MSTARRERSMLRILIRREVCQQICDKDHAHKNTILVGEMYKIRYNDSVYDETLWSGMLNIHVVITLNLSLSKRNVLLVFNLHDLCITISITFVTWYIKILQKQITTQGTKLDEIRKLNPQWLESLRRKLIVNSLAQNSNLEIRT